MNNNFIYKILQGEVTKEEMINFIEQTVEARDFKEKMGEDTEKEEKALLIVIYGFWLYEGMTSEDFRQQRALSSLRDFYIDVMDSEQYLQAIGRDIVRCESLYREYLKHKDKELLRASYMVLEKMIDIVDYAALREMEMCRSNGSILMLVEMRRDMDKLGYFMEKALQVSTGIS